MTMIIRRTALSLAALTLMLIAPVSSPVFSAPVETSTIAVGDQPTSVAFSPNGKLAYVTNHGVDSVSVITVKTGSVASTIAVGDRPSSVAFSPGAYSTTMNLSVAPQPSGSFSDAGTTSPCNRQVFLQL